MDFKKLEISPNKISWETNSNFIVYQTDVLSHGLYVSVLKKTLIHGEIKSVDLVHIPNALLDKIKQLTNAPTGEKKES